MSKDSKCYQIDPKWLRGSLAHSCSFRTNLVSFRTFRLPLFPKPVSWLGLFCRFLQQTGYTVYILGFGFVYDAELKCKLALMHSRPQNRRRTENKCRGAALETFSMFLVYFLPDNLKNSKLIKK